MSDNTLGKKNILENSWLNSFSIPILIMAFGAFIIFGVTKILSTDRGYKDLVLELNSKSFGNKWVSAYELSKVINSSQVKNKDIPWLVENLKSVYFGAIDVRTKQFVIVALGALKSDLAIDVYNDALKQQKLDNDVLLQALMAISNLPKATHFSELTTGLLKKYFKSDELIIKQTLFLLVAKFKLIKFENYLVEGLRSKKKLLRYTAAIALTPFQHKNSIKILKEILSMIRDVKVDNIDESQRLQLINNVLIGLKKSKWNILLHSVEKIAKNEKNLKLREAARKYLK